MLAEALSGGFADPAPEAARAFRAILNAMARPGTVELVAGAAPPGISPAAGVALLVLADRSTPLWLAPSVDRPALRDWITFHCAAPLARPEAAAFALGRWDEMPWRHFPQGTAEYPDRSATVIVEVDGFAPPTHRLTGPGIVDSAMARLPGDRPQARFPLGLDLLLCAGDRLAALPRTTRAEAL